MGGRFRRFVDAMRANITPAVPARVLSNAAGTTNIFQPSLTRPVEASYSFSLDFEASVAASEARIELRYGPTSPPNAFVKRGGLGYDVGGLLTALDARIEFTLTAIIPKGYYVALVPVVVAGTVVSAIESQVETPL